MTISFDGSRPILMTCLVNRTDCLSACILELISNDGIPTVPGAVLDPPGRYKSAGARTVCGDSCAETGSVNGGGLAGGCPPEGSTRGGACNGWRGAGCNCSRGGDWRAESSAARCSLEI